MILALICAVVALFVILVYAIVSTAAGPDLDLIDTWCPRCGGRGGRHVHAGWTERGPR